MAFALAVSAAQQALKGKKEARLAAQEQLEAERKKRNRNLLLIGLGALILIGGLIYVSEK